MAQTDKDSALPVLRCRASRWWPRRFHFAFIDTRIRQDRPEELRPSRQHFMQRAGRRPGYMGDQDHSHRSQADA